ncbi:hypothetical protein [Acidipropionibacterium acidipropionici]|uniref:hypothetical protein n=1 Tax=Acidipropionibacterium acidipropionici TaxID=1748 RepID=UPI000412A9E1|nr:hypothetical protein [Acidipropionibacterium acidipropionici]ALN14372.1 hypothetical protein ASQ49_02775 [Acidipropionibacterium acidipropionici]APZ09867.1 hypothetical protein BWX38_12175 [Acidipropionibacterium acidipropionici]
MTDPTTDTDGVLDLLMDDMRARDTILEENFDPESGGLRWASRSATRSIIAGVIRNGVLLTRAAAILLREDVAQAREDGLSWDEIAEALDTTAAEAERRYGTATH